MSEGVIVALIALAGAVITPLWLDIRKANREEAERRDSARLEAAERAAQAHRDALAAKDREIAYWRDLALSCLLPRGEAPPSGPREPP